MELRRLRRCGCGWRGLILFAAPLLTACLDPTGTASRSIELDIRTDQTEYVLGVDTAISVALVNRGVRPAFVIVPSYFIILQTRRGEGWDDLPPWYGLLTVARRWLPITDLDTLTAGPTLDEFTIPEIIPGTGIYRFRYILYADSTRAALLPLRDRVSNIFEIVQ